MKLGTIESIWRYPVKGMRGEEIPHVYTGFAGLMGDRIYGVIAADGDPAFPWHTGRDQEEFVLYEATYKSGESLLLPKDLDAFEGLAPGINPVYPDADAFKVDVQDARRRDLRHRKRGVPARPGKDHRPVAAGCTSPRRASMTAGRCRYSPCRRPPSWARRPA